MIIHRLAHTTTLRYTTEEGPQSSLVKPVKGEEKTAHSSRIGKSSTRTGNGKVSHGQLQISMGTLRNLRVKLMSTRQPISLTATTLLSSSGGFPVWTTVAPHNHFGPDSVSTTMAMLAMDNVSKRERARRRSILLN